MKLLYKTKCSRFCLYDIMILLISQLIPVCEHLFCRLIDPDDIAEIICRLCNAQTGKLRLQIRSHLFPVTGQIDPVHFFPQSHGIDQCSINVKKNSFYVIQDAVQMIRIVPVSCIHSF